MTRMTLLSLRAPIEYAVLLLGDRNGKFPRTMEGKLVASTESSIAVTCIPDADGDTEIIVGSSEEIATDDALVFDGVVCLPTQTFIIRPVVGPELYVYPHRIDSIALRVWANHPAEPDRITIAIAERP